MLYIRTRDGQLHEAHGCAILDKAFADGVGEIPVAILEDDDDTLVVRLANNRSISVIHTNTEV